MTGGWSGVWLLLKTGCAHLSIHPVGFGLDFPFLRLSCLCKVVSKEDVFAVAVKVGLNRKDAIAEFDKMEKCIFGSVSDGH